MHLSLSTRAAIIAACLLVAPLVAHAGIIASDDADNTTYNSGWNTSGAGSNGGVGFGTWAQDESTGGGRYLETSGGQVTGARSFALYSGGGGYAMYRPLAASMESGEVVVTVRHNVDNGTAFTGIGIKSAQGSSFGDQELLAAGLTPGTSNGKVGIFGGTNTTITPTNNGELRGDSITYDLQWNTNAGTYFLSVHNNAKGTTDSTSGTLKSSGSPVAGISFGNFNTGSNQNVIFDALSISTLAEIATASISSAPTHTNLGTVSITRTGPNAYTSAPTTITDAATGSVRLNNLGPENSGALVALWLTGTSQHVTDAINALIAQGLTLTTLANAGSDPDYAGLVNTYPSTYGSSTLLLHFPVTTDANNDYFNWDLSQTGAKVAEIAAVPEPASLSLLAVAGVALAVRRKRTARF